jgi:hypothetical protein
MSLTTEPTADRSPILQVDRPLSGTEIITHSRGRRAALSRRAWKTEAVRTAEEHRRGMYFVLNNARWRTLPCLCLGRYRRASIRLVLKSDKRGF